MKWSFSYNSLQNSMVKNFGHHNMSVLYPNQCYNEVFYKGTVVYTEESL